MQKDLSKILEIYAITQSHCLTVSERVASRTGAEKPLSYLLCEAKALKIRLSLRMKVIRFYNLNIIKHLTR